MISNVNESSISFMHDIDPRVKIFFTVEILVLIGLSDSFTKLLVPMILPLVLTIYVNGLKSIFSQIWNLKFYFFIFFVFGLVFTRYLSIKELFFIFVKFFILYISFIALSKTTTPDQITDGLIKLKLPPTFSWAVGVTMRQVYFIFDEISNIREIHRLKINAKNTIKQNKFQEIANLIIAIYSNSIIRSETFTKSIKSRGFKSAHPTIITYSKKPNSRDLFFFLISLIPLITFIILSSQLFIS